MDKVQFCEVSGAKKMDGDTVYHTGLNEHLMAKRKEYLIQRHHSRAP